MISQELKQLKTGPRDLRRFGLLVGGVFALLAAWSWWRGKPFFPYFLVAAVPLIGLGLLWPASLRWVYLGWMSVALLLGLVVSTLLLTVFFYVVVTPIGLLARAMGKDFLNRRFEPEAKSYWIQRRPSARGPGGGYERQF